MLPYCVTHKPSYRLFRDHTAQKGLLQGKADWKREQNRQLRDAATAQSAAVQRSVNSW